MNLNVTQTEDEGKSHEAASRIHLLVAQTDYTDFNIY